ncbi:DUF6279 family lipoprotein [Pseudidiomarina salilacus]|uniref:DUF6279 family lipoprotein n=1 Tax=Pseudidiomarina salilacus TaxID=3384452 RepID=UPI003984B937
MRTVSLKLLTIIVVTLLFSGCSTQFGYRFADTYLEYQLGKYVDLDDPLAGDVSASIDALHQWHAQTQMPAYADFLTELINAVENDRIDAQQLNQFADDAYRFWHTIRLEIEPYAQRYLPQLSAAQRAQFITKMREQITEERVEELAQEPRKRQRERFQRTIDRAEEWLGRLAPEQERLLHRWMEQRERNDELWHRYQMQWLDSFERTIKNPSAEDFSASLEQLITNPEQFRSEELQQSSDYNRALTIEFFVAIYATMSVEQKRKVRNKLADYRELVTDIHKDYAD